MSIIIDKDEYVDTYHRMNAACGEMDDAVNSYKSIIKELELSLHVPVDLFFQYCKEANTDVTVRCKRTSMKWPHFTSVPKTELFGIHKKPNDSIVIHHDEEWETIWLRDVYSNVGAIALGEVTDHYVEVITEWNEPGLIKKPQLSIRLPIELVVGHEDHYQEFNALIREIERTSDELNIIGKTIESAELSQLEVLIAKHPEFAKSVFEKIKDCK